MNRYEIMYLVSPKIKDEDLSPLIDQIRTLIAKQDGKIVEEEEWGKKKLAYPIKHFRHGFYYIIYVDLDPTKVSELEKDLKLSDDILRYLIIKHDKQTWQAIQDQKKRATTRAAEETEKEESKKEEIKKEEKEPAKEEPKKAKKEMIEKPEPEPKTAKKSKVKKEKEDAKKARKDEAKKEKAKLDELDKKLDEILDEDIIE